MLQWGRGSLAAACRLGKLTRSSLGASMGPRLISRGVISIERRNSNADMLQWGRGSLAAAWANPHDINNDGIVLQWGRGSLAAA